MTPVIYRIGSRDIKTSEMLNFICGLTTGHQFTGSRSATSYLQLSENKLGRAASRIPLNDVYYSPSDKV